MRAVAFFALLLGTWTACVGLAVGQYLTALGAAVSVLAVWRIAPR